MELPKLKKIRKPLLEKQRRERINRSLDKLKMIIIEDAVNGIADFGNNANGSSSSSLSCSSISSRSSSKYLRLEKADILEKTLLYISGLQCRLSAINSEPKNVYTFAGRTSKVPHQGAITRTTLGDIGHSTNMYYRDLRGNHRPGEERHASIMGCIRLPHQGAPPRTILGDIGTNDDVYRDLRGNHRPAEERYAERLEAIHQPDCWRPWSNNTRSWRMLSPVGIHTALFCYFFRKPRCIYCDLFTKMGNLLIIGPLPFCISIICYIYYINISCLLIYLMNIIWNHGFYSLINPNTTTTHPPQYSPPQNHTTQLEQKRH